MPMTPARRNVLRRCAEPDGLRPTGRDWQAIYWLRDQGFVQVDKASGASRYSKLYRATNTGLAFLKESETP